MPEAPFQYQASPAMHVDDRVALGQFMSTLSMHLRNGLTPADLHQAWADGMCAFVKHRDRSEPEPVWLVKMREAQAALPA